jgi:hypothetical protein
MANGADIVGKLLAFVDRPWKAIALAGLMIVGGTLYALWQERAQIASAILQHHVAPHLKPDEFPRIAAQLMRETGADMITLAEASLLLNLVRNQQGILRDRPDWQPDPLPRTLLSDDVDAELLAELIEGRIKCAIISSDSRQTERRVEAALGMTRICVCSVPPILGIFVGALIAGWKQPLSIDAELGAGQALKAAAMKLAVW